MKPQTLAVTLMRRFITIVLLLLVVCRVSSQSGDKLVSPIIHVNVAISKDTFGVNDDIQLTMTLRNDTKEIQSIWFDRPISSTRGPAMTSVSIIDKRTNKSVLKYENKGILNSQAYTDKELRPFLYDLKPGQSVSGRFSLYDMVVTNTESLKLNKGTYEMRVFYYNNLSNRVIFTII